MDLELNMLDCALKMMDFIRNNDGFHTIYIAMQFARGDFERGFGYGAGYAQDLYEYRGSGEHIGKLSEFRFECPNFQ